MVFDDVLCSDAPLVTSAPTGSGKTVLFELAIVRLLIQMEGNLSRVKVIYGIWNMLKLSYVTLL